MLRSRWLTNPLAVRLGSPAQILNPSANDLLAYSFTKLHELQGMTSCSCNSLLDVPLQYRCLLLPTASASDMVRNRTAVGRPKKLRSHVWPKRTKGQACQVHQHTGSCSTERETCKVRGAAFRHGRRTQNGGLPSGGRPPGGLTPTACAVHMVPQNASPRRPAAKHLTK